jgi:hypothetical protein
MTPRSPSPEQPVIAGRVEPGQASECLRPLARLLLSLARLRQEAKDQARPPATGKVRRRK